MKAFIVISALCVSCALAAKSGKVNVSQEGKKQEKRGLYDFGTYANDHNGNQWSSNIDFGGLKISTGFDFTNTGKETANNNVAHNPYTMDYTVKKKESHELKHSDTQQQAIETKVSYTPNGLTKASFYVPQPETVNKSPYQLEEVALKPYEVPNQYNTGTKSSYSVQVPVSQPNTVEMKIPYQVNYEAPQQYDVEEKVPYEAYADKTYNVYDPKLYKDVIAKYESAPTEKPHSNEVNVPVVRPYILTPTSYSTKETLPTTNNKGPVNKPYPVYTKVPTAVKNEVPVQVPIKTSSHGIEENGHFGRDKQWQPIIKGQHDGQQYVANFHQTLNEGNHQQDLSQVQKYQSQHNLNAFKSNSEGEKNQQQLDSYANGFGSEKGAMYTSFPVPKEQSSAGNAHASSYFEFNFGNNAKTGQKQENVVQWQYSTPELANYNKQVNEDQGIQSNVNVKIGQNKFESPKENKIVDLANYQSVYSNSMDKKERNQQTNNVVLSKFENNYDAFAQLEQQFGHEFTEQLKNSLKGFEQFQPVGYDNSLQITSTHQPQQAVSHSAQLQQPNYNQGNKLQEQPGDEEKEEQGYKYNVPEKSLHIKSGNTQPKQHQYSMPVQQHVQQFILQTDKVPQPHKSYKAKANSVAVKPEQLQIDYESYEKSFPQQAQALIQQHSVYLGGEGQDYKYADYQSQLQQPSYTPLVQSIGQVGIYDHKTIGQIQNNYKEQERQPKYTSQTVHSSHKSKEQDGYTEIKQNYKGLEQPSTYTPSTKSNGLNYESNEYSYKNFEQQQPIYMYHDGFSNYQAIGHHEQSQGNAKTATPSHTSHMGYSNQPIYTSNSLSSSHQNIGETGAYHKTQEQEEKSHTQFTHQTVQQHKTNNDETVKQTYQQYTAQIKQQPKYTSVGKSKSYNLGKGQSSYKLNAEKQPIYTSHSGSSSYQTIESVGHESVDQQQANHVYQGKQSAVTYQVPSINYGQQHFGNHHQIQSQSNYLIHGASSGHGQQNLKANEHAGYRNHAVGADKSRKN